MIEIIRKDSTDADFIRLVNLLDAELKIRDGEDHDFYNQFNHIDSIKHVVVLYENEIAVACGAIKKYDNSSAEIKRMYTMVSNRSQGLASAIINELEIWANILGYKKCILETGINQPEAIALYKKSGFHIIPNYGQYEGLETSYCFEKALPF